MIKGIKNIIIHDRGNKARDIPCEINEDGVTISIPGGETIVVSQQELVTLAFVAAKPEFQDYLVKSTTQEVRVYKKQHTVKVQKDLKAGEEMVVNCEVNIPVLIENRIKEELQNEKVNG